MRLLDEERRVLARILYKSRNQHKSSLILRRMVHLDRLLRRPCLDKRKIVECSQDLYIAGSSQLAMGFFVPLGVCVMACAARVFYLVSRIPDTRRSQIDDIFEGL